MCEKEAHHLCFNTRISNEGASLINLELNVKLDMDGPWAPHLFVESPGHVMEKMSKISPLSSPASVPCRDVLFKAPCP